MIHDDTSLSISVRTRSSYCSAVRTADVAHTFAKTLLETLRAHPESLIGDLNIISQRDYDQIMEWNKVIPQSVETTFHEHFKNIAQQMPDSPAICSWDGNFTYHELDTLSTRLAHRLADLGVELETLVLICFDKSAYAIVSMLGIMKVGCAFVAIDPSYPASRIQAILRATKATIVVAEPAHEHLFQDAVAHVVKLDAQSAEELPLTPATVASRPSASPSNLAYVVFTSGSTGSPKGIQVEHRALCTAARHLATPMRIHSSIRHLNFAAFTFDLSYGDIFVTLAQGACLCLPSEEERINDLAGAIVRMEVNSACLVPSVARILRPEDVPRLQTLSLGGEALVQENLTLWAPRIALNNMYGPSECTIWCCSNMNLKANSAANNIGRGVGALLWITSPINHDHLCPIGCIGELLIEGPVMARGYLDAEQTLGSFVENPSWAMGESRTRRRFYKTGDLVRYNPDGTVSFMGRKDTQVKVHGRRIELGEIEYQLASHDALRQSMVILPSTGVFASRLVAVMVVKSISASQETTHELKAVTGHAKEQSVAEVAKIKAFLAPRVPHYMLPQFWVVVEAIPLMISGKMNRVLVKRFVESQTKDSSDVVRVNGITTRPPVEDLLGQRLREIWSQVMKHPLADLGLDQSFESLGGDSFSAMELVARCKTEGIVLTVHDLQSSSTIREVASMVKLRSSGSWNTDAPSDAARTGNTHLTLRPALTFPPIWWNIQPAVVS
jgi:amino acid adenylation domain-containing protein